MTPRVILIGGAPMSGKSTVARVLALRLGRACISTDDLGVAVRALMPRRPDEDHREYYLTRSVEQLWQEALEGHRQLAPAIEAVAKMHATWGAPAVIEGWAILPETAPELARVWLQADRALLETRVRADRAFWAGASDEEAMMTKFVERSLCLNRHLSEAAPLVPVTAQDSPEAIADRILALW